MGGNVCVMVEKGNLRARSLNNACALIMISVLIFWDRLDEICRINKLIVPLSAVEADVRRRCRVRCV